MDHVPCLQAWAKSLGGIDYPLLSDFWPHGAVSTAYGVLRPDGFTERAIFIVDREGIIRYVDVHDIGQQPSNADLLEALRQIDPTAAASQPQEAELTAADLPHGGIVMYCTPWCSDCMHARQWLAAHNLPYTEVDISRSRAAARQVEEWANGYQTTPTFEIDGEIVVDFDEARLRAVLKLPPAD